MNMENEMKWNGKKMCEGKTHGNACKVKVADFKSDLMFPKLYCMKHAYM